MVPFNHWSQSLELLLEKLVLLLISILGPLMLSEITLSNLLGCLLMISIKIWTVRPEAIVKLQSENNFKSQTDKYLLEI